MKNKMVIVVIVIILIVGCIFVYYSNKNGMFGFDLETNKEITNIEKENNELSLKELSKIVFTKNKDIKKVTDMDDLELIHAAIGISVNYVDTITGKEIKDIVKKHFGVDNVRLVDITCDLDKTEYHDNRMYIYNSKKDKYESNPEHISHVANSDGITYYIVNGKETTQDDSYIFTGQIFYVYNGCNWDVCGHTGVYDVYLSYEDALNKTNKQFNAYEKEEFCSKTGCSKSKVYEEIKDKIKTVNFYYRKKNNNYVFEHYEVK